MISVNRYVPMMAVGGIVVIATLAIQGDAVWLDTAVLVAIHGLLALSVGITWGQAGLLSIAQAGFAAVGAYITAIGTTEYDLPPLVALPLSIFVPALIAYPLARLVTRLAPLALAIATLAFSEVLYALIAANEDLTGGYLGIPGIPRLSFADDRLSFHIFSWLLVGVVLLLYTNLTRSRVGHSVRVLRHDRARAIADGINVSRRLSSYFALAAGIAGLAGWLYAHYIGYLGTDSLGVELSISVVLMAIVGGAATTVGPLLGAAILTLADHLLPSAEVRGLFYGVAVIVIVLLMPQGILTPDRKFPWRGKPAGPKGSSGETPKPEPSASAAKIGGPHA